MRVRQHIGMWKRAVLVVNVVCCLHVFTLGRYFKNGESVVQKQRGFRIHFDLPRYGTILNHYTVLR